MGSGTNVNAGQTARDLIMVLGTMILCVLLVLMVGIAALGLLALSMYSLYYLLGTAVTLMAIGQALRVLSLPLRAVSWHGLWFLFSLGACGWLITRQQPLWILYGLPIGLILSTFIGRRTEHVTSEKVMAGQVESYTSARGRVHVVIDLTPGDYPGGPAGERIMAKLIGGWLLALAIMGWGSYLDLFGAADRLLPLWALLAGGVFGYTFSTLLITVLWIERRYHAHVFFQFLPTRFLQRLVGEVELPKPGPASLGLSPGQFFTDLRLMARDLYSMSVHR